MSKKVFFVVFFLASLRLFAGNAHMFSYEMKHVNQALATVNVVNRYLDQHPMSFDQLQKDAGFFAAMASENAPRPMPENTLKSWYFWGNTAFTFGGVFFLGFLGIGCGLVGVLGVYLITQNSDETVNSLLGCVAGTVLGIGCYFVVYGALLATTPTY